MFVLLVAHFISNVFLSCGHDFIQLFFSFFSFIGQYSALFLALAYCRAWTIVIIDYFLLRVYVCPWQIKID